VDETPLTVAQEGDHQAVYHSGPTGVGETDQAILGKVDRDVEKAFGFVADPTKSKLHNALIYLSNIPR
jgi:hypothetical protein